MPKIILFSDVHVHNFKPCSKITPDGLNSRMMDAVSCIRQVHEYAYKTKADLVLFGGDLFHERKHISTVAFNMAWRELQEFKDCGIPLLMLHGNHDQADRLGHQHALTAMQGIAEVVGETTWGWTRSADVSVNLLTVPYIEDYDNLKEVLSIPKPAWAINNGWPTILLGHMGVNGAEVGADFVYRNPMECYVSDLQLERFDACFLGHFHKHQKFAENAWYIGSPLQHNWGDKGQKRGLVVYDTDKRTVEHVELQAPKFIETYPLSEQNTRIKLSGNFVRMIDPEEWSMDKKEAFQAETGAAHLEVVKPAIQKADHEIRMAVESGFSISDVIEQYVSANIDELDDVDEEYLISIGREIVESVE